MKKEREFLMELNGNKDVIPYVEFFKKDKVSRNKLFEDYLQTELKPNLSLYAKSHFTNEDWINGWEETHKNIPETTRPNKLVMASFVAQTEFETRVRNLDNECIDLDLKKQLPEEFYSHFNTETDIYKKLNFVENRFNDFDKNFTLDNPFEYGIDFAKSIIYELDLLKHPKLKEVVLNEFIAEKENSYITLMFAFNENTKYISKNDALKKYEDYKDSIKNYIVENLKNDNYINENEAKSNKIKIDIDYINELLLNRRIRTILMGIKEDENEIIPKNLTHTNLLESKYVSDNSEKYYFYPTSHLISVEFYEKFKNIYIGKIENIVNPYSLKIFGAYYHRDDIYTKLLDLDRNDTSNGNKVKYFSDLIPYFKEYANGFKNGFDKFYNDCVKLYLLPEPDKTGISKEVFKYITSNIGMEFKWNNKRSGFVKTGSKLNEITGGYEDGQKQGYFYRAWCYVFSMNELFTPLFDEYYNHFSSNNEPQQIEKLKTKKLKKTLLEFINNIKNKEAFILELKKTFPTEKGKEIRVIIDKLKEENVLIIGAREYKHFVEELTVYFDRNIGKYQGIQNQMTITTETSDPIYNKLIPLINNHKIKKLVQIV